jgi:hypothetical protein
MKCYEPLDEGGFLVHEIMRNLNTWCSWSVEWEHGKMARRRRKRSRNVPRMPRRKGKRSGSCPRVSTEVDSAASAPLKDPGPRTERGWVDPLGITHRVFLYNELWIVLCDTPYFSTRLREFGNRSVRINTSTPTCLSCALMDQ